MSYRPGSDGVYSALFRFGKPKIAVLFNVLLNPRQLGCFPFSGTSASLFLSKKWITVRSTKLPSNKLNPHPGQAHGEECQETAYWLSYPQRLNSWIAAWQPNWSTWVICKKCWRTGWWLQIFRVWNKHEEGKRPSSGHCSKSCPSRRCKHYGNPELIRGQGYYFLWRGLRHAASILSWRFHERS